MIPKNPHTVNLNFRALANGEDCTMRVPGVCNFNTETTVLAHSNSLKDGKGKGYKGNDHSGIFACYACHTWLDQGRAPAEERQAAFYRAQVRMIERLGEIVCSPTMRPDKVAAARWALEHIAEDLTGVS